LAGKIPSVRKRAALATLRLDSSEREIRDLANRLCALDPRLGIEITSSNAQRENPGARRPLLTENVASCCAPPRVATLLDARHPLWRH